MLQSQSQPGEAPPSPPAGPARPQAAIQDSPPAGPARPQATVRGSPPIDVEDRLERRIRKPIDLLRFTVTCGEIALLAGFGVVASATTTGVETNIVAASRHVPYIALAAARPLTLFALLVLPIALAGRELVRGRGRRLAEAAATGMLAVAVVLVANALLRSSAGAKLYDAITMSRPGASHMTPLDAYLAGLVAYTTMIGFSGRPRWRTALWLVLGGYALVNLAALHTTVLSLLITLLAGRAVGLGVRYAAGSMSQRPSAEELAVAVSTEQRQVTGIRRIWHVGVESRHYLATARNGESLDVYVYDRDQQAAGVIYRLYRRIRVRYPVSHDVPLSIDRAVEHRALLSYAAGDVEVPTPRLRALLRVGPECIVLGYEHHEGTTLAERGTVPTDAELQRIWDAVRRLHAFGVTHGALTADRILLTPDGQVMLLDLGSGDVAAGELQIRLDLVQLLAELALCVGVDRAASLATSSMSADELVAVVPLLQAVVLEHSTRKALRHRRDVLPALRQRLLAAVPGGEVQPVQLERIRLRTLVTLVASVVAAYLLAGELARSSLVHVLGSANWGWGVVALGLSALTYVATAWSLTGFVPIRLSLTRTVLAQLAGSFVKLVTPAAVGSAALNLRYLQRSGVPGPVAAASVGVSQVVALVQHTLLLVVFAALTGASASHSLSSPPVWVYFALAGLAAVVAATLALPAGRRLLRARLSPALGQILPRLLQVAQQPRKLAQGIGGTFLLSGLFILCLAVCVRAFGGSVALPSVAVVYLTSSVVGSLVPTPGGLGAVEAALSAGLRAAGLAGAVAISATLLFRLLTFWLPVPFGWAALKYLERQHAL